MVKKTKSTTGFVRKTVHQSPTITQTDNPVYTTSEKSSPDWGKRIFFLILFLGILGGSLFVFVNRGDNAIKNSNSNRPTNSVSNQNRNTNSNTNSSNPNEQNAPIPKELKLTVPFTSQAPTANWDELHNEACEEASLIMANAYFNGITSLPPATVEKEIDKMTEYQKKEFGYYLSINTPEFAKMTEDVYGLKAEIKTFSEQTIKQALANDKLVIYPAMGQMLGNPNFTGEGPIYHMLVITGYDDDGNYITNDPGTRKGLNYKYSFSTLEDAAGNWVHSAHAVDTTDKRIIIVSK